MRYTDGFVAAVPAGNREAYLRHAKAMAAVLQAHGALRVVDAWGDDVLEGKLTSFPLAVKREDGEVVAFGWIEWPSRAVRDAGWEKAMQDPRMSSAQMPFDGKRMIYGGFETLSDVAT